MFTVPLNVAPLAVMPPLNVAELLNVAGELNVGELPLPNVVGAVNVAAPVAALNDVWLPAGPIVKRLGEEKSTPVSPVWQVSSMAMSKAPSEWVHRVCSPEGCGPRFICARVRPVVQRRAAEPSMSTTSVETPCCFPDLYPQHPTRISMSPISPPPVAHCCSFTRLMRPAPRLLGRCP